MAPGLFSSFVLNFMDVFSIVDEVKVVSDSVNATVFSPDGAYLAIGSDNGHVLIYNYRDCHLVYRYIDTSPITALLWHPVDRYTLFVGGGYGKCSIYQLSAKSPVRSFVASMSRVQVLTEFPSRTESG